LTSAVQMPARAPWRKTFGNACLWSQGLARRCKRWPTPWLGDCA